MATAAITTSRTSGHQERRLEVAADGAGGNGGGGCGDLNGGDAARVVDPKPGEAGVDVGSGYDAADDAPDADDEPGLDAGPDVDAGLDADDGPETDAGPDTDDGPDTDAGPDADGIAEAGDDPGDATPPLDPGTAGSDADDVGPVSLTMRTSLALAAAVPSPPGLWIAPPGTASFPE